MLSEFSKIGATAAQGGSHRFSVFSKIFVLWEYEPPLGVDSGSSGET